MPTVEQDRKQQTFLPKPLNQLSVKQSDSKCEHDVGDGVTRTNLREMERPILCSLHRKPVGLMPNPPTSVQAPHQEGQSHAASLEALPPSAPAHTLFVQDAP